MNDDREYPPDRQQHLASVVLAKMEDLRQAIVEWRSPSPSIDRAMYHLGIVHGLLTVAADEP